MKILFLLSFIFLFGPALVHAANWGDAVISEIAWMGSAESSRHEWIELYNNGGEDIDLAGWRIRATTGTTDITIGTDAANRVTVNSIIPAKGFYLLEWRTASMIENGEKVNAGVEADWYGTFSKGLKNSGERVELLDTQGNEIDVVNAFGWGWFAGDNIIDNYTMERKSALSPGSDAASWANSQNPGGTPKAPNSRTLINADNERINADTNTESLTQTQQTTAPSQNTTAEESASISSNQHKSVTENNANATSLDPKNETPTAPNYPTNIFINELMPFPLGPDELEEWVELINENEEAANISGWQIKDMSGAAGAYTFPDGMTVPAGGFLVLSRQTTNITMNNDTDAVQLIRPDGELIQTAPYEKAQRGKSYVRNSGILASSEVDGLAPREVEGWQWSSIPTPGSANIVPAPQKSSGTVKDVKETVKKYVESPPIPSEELSPSAGDLPLIVADEPSAETVNQIGGNKKIASIGGADFSSPFFSIASFAAFFIALLSAIFVFILKKRLNAR